MQPRCWAGRHSGLWFATMTIVVRCRAGPVSRAPRYVGTDTPTSRNRTPPRRLGLSTNRQTMVSYGVVSSPTSPPIQPPRVRNLLVRALRATPRGNNTPQNRGLWDVAHPPGGGGGGLRRDTTTKPGPLRGPGRDPTWHGWGRSWPDGSVGMSRSRPPSKSTGWYGWDGRYRTPKASPPIFARCFARPQLCHRRHQGACGNTRLNQHRARRLDENLETRTRHSDHSSPTGPVPAPNPATTHRQTIPVTAPEPRVIDHKQLEASLARLPKPLAAQLARLATRHHVRRSDQ